MVENENENLKLVNSTCDTYVVLNSNEKELEKSFDSKASDEVIVVPDTEEVVKFRNHRTKLESTMKEYQKKLRKAAIDDGESEWMVRLKPYLEHEQRCIIEMIAEIKTVKDKEWRLLLGMDDWLHWRELNYEKFYEYV